MAIDRNEARAAGFGEALIQLAKETSGLSSLIEGIRAYHENIEDQQRRAFAAEFTKRVNELEKHVGWYETPDGAEFVKKIIATSLNAEYADKLQFLANALVNGPSLGDDQARRLKFVEMVRQLSKSALQVLAASLDMPNNTGQVMPGQIAQRLDWTPSLVDACVRELYAVGAYSHVMSWSTDGEPRPEDTFDDGTAAITEISRHFAQFVAGV